jgi:HAD superfamily hydrolase (TIGR01509 family)
MMFKAIIFDVDGTLSETEDTHRKAFNQAFDKNGLPWHWHRQLYRQLLKVSGGKERIRHFIETHEPDRLLSKHLDGFIRDLHAAKTAIYTRMVADGEAKLRPGVMSLIDQSFDDGIRLAIATTTSLPNVEALLLSTYGEEGINRFEVICAGDVVDRKKPAPDIYLLALTRLGLPAEDCVAIEDSRNGLLSAHQAGIATIITPSIYTDDQNFDEAVLVAANLDDVDFPALYAAFIATPQ